MVGHLTTESPTKWKARLQFFTTKTSKNHKQKSSLTSLPLDMKYTTVLLFCVFVVLVQSALSVQHLTPSQMDEGVFLMNKLAQVANTKASCKFYDETKNETCLIHVDETIKIAFITQHIEFDAAVSARVDLHNFNILLLATVNQNIVFLKQVPLDKLKDPICTKIFNVLELCAQFDHINFSVDAQCFTADLNVFVKFMTMQIKLLSDKFGWNQSKCPAIQYL